MTFTFKWGWIKFGMNNYWWNSWVWIHRRFREKDSHGCSGKDRTYHFIPGNIRVFLYRLLKK